VQPPRFSAEQRARSFKALSGLRVGTEPLERYLFARDAIVITGATVATFEPNGKTTVTSAGFPNVVGLGTAAAIDSRGYFITAGHVANGAPLNVFWQEDGDPATATWHYAVARLVWRSLPGDKMDLALLRVPKALASVFTWSDDVHLGEQVAASGGGRVPTERLNFNLGTVGGNVAEVEAHDGQGTRWTEVRHTAPLYFGDSGGPLVNARGELLAINTGERAETHFFPYTEIFQAVSARPDPGWLRRVIDDDWAQRGGRTP
jgi:S1-C subfamily serine protease